MRLSRASFKMGRHPRTYRSISATRGAVFATVLLVVFIIIAVVPGKGQVVGFIFAPLWLIGTWRVWHLGVEVEDDGVKVVGVLISKRIAWGEIDHFEVRPWQRYPYQGHVVMKNGRVIPILGIGAAGRPKRRDEIHRLQVQEPIDRLNGVLADWNKNRTVV